MAEMSAGGGGSHGKHDKKRAKKLSTRVDMTPMVDLAFLLLTFFVLTATFSKPKVLTLIVPENKKDDDNTKLSDVKNGITFLVDDKDKIYYYKGALRQDNLVKETNYTKDGLRKLLVDGNKWFLNELDLLTAERNKISDKDTGKIRVFNKKLYDTKMNTNVLKVVVKNVGNATYRNIIDIVDEIGIAQIPVYLVSEDKLTDDEKSYLEKLKRGGNQ